MPKGIEKDDAYHGQIYFTRHQMRAYGKTCVDFAMAQIYESAKQTAGGKSAVEQLFGIFGMKK